MFLGETLARDKVRRMDRKWWERKQRVFWDAADVAKVFWKGGGNWADLLGNFLVG